MASAATRWRDLLARWAIPDYILETAEESPWIHPPVLFEVPDDIQRTPSHDRAREALAEGGSVLDVGCGGGAAAFALTPPATRVIGVDEQPAMLEMFRANAQRRHVACETVQGVWPDVAGQTPSADVVTAHHVVYNVPDIEPFLRALNRHARSRVVLEMPDQHPLASMSAAWRHFWQLERPDGPTPADLIDVLAELGIAARSESWRGDVRTTRDPTTAARFLRIRLCLPASREPEVRDYLAANPLDPGRLLTTIWWDATRP